MITLFFSGTVHVRLEAQPKALGNHGQNNVPLHQCEAISNTKMGAPSKRKIGLASSFGWVLG